MKTRQRNKTYIVSKANVIRVSNYDNSALLELRSQHDSNFGSHIKAYVRLSLPMTCLPVGVKQGDVVNITIHGN